MMFGRSFNIGRTCLNRSNAMQQAQTPGTKNVVISLQRTKSKSIGHRCWLSSMKEHPEKVNRKRCPKNRQYVERLPRNHSKTKHTHDKRVSDLEQSSRNFLETFPRLHPGRQAYGLASHLLEWQPILSALQPQILARILPLIDEMACILMDTALQTEKKEKFVPLTKNAVGVNDALLVTIPIHGWAKLQSHQHYSPSTNKIINNHSSDNASSSIHTSRSPARNAEVLLLRLEETYSKTGDIKFQPTVESYNGVLDAMGKSFDPEAANRATSLLQHMLKISETGENPLARPNGRSWNSIMNAWATLGEADKTMELLRLREKHIQYPDKYAFSIVTKAWLRSGRPEAAVRVRAFLDECIANYQQDPNKCGHVPVAMQFATLVKLYVHQPEKGQEVFDEMIAWYRKTGHADLTPENRHFVSLMNAWAKVGNAERVEGLLLQMQEHYEEGNEKCKPDHITFVVVIDAWCRHRTLQGAEKANSILHKMEEKFLGKNERRLNNSGQQRGKQRLNTYGYNLVMDAYAQLGKVDRAEEVFRRMEKLGQHYNNVEMLPDKVSYTSLMKAFIKEGKPGFADRVESMLEQMEAERRPSSNPDTIAYACVLDALSKSGQRDAGERAIAILRRMETLHTRGNNSVAPNAICFNTIINIYSKLGQPKKAEEILSWMEESARGGCHVVNPTSVTYTTCIDAWARINASEEALSRAMAIYKTMTRLYREGDSRCKPEPDAFSLLLLTLARSPKPNRLPMALDLMREMDGFGIQNNNVVSNSFLTAVSGSKGGDEILREALKECVVLFQTMRRSKHMRPDTITYEKMCHVFNQLVKSTGERNQALVDLFHKCCEDDMLNQRVLELFCRFLPKEIYSELTGNSAKRA